MCHLKHGHVLLIQGSNYQIVRSAVSPDIHIQYFFENCLYQENRWTGFPVVKPLPRSYSPDTSSNCHRDRSAASRDNDAKFFSKIVCIRSTARRGVSPCTLFQGQVLQIQGLNFQEYKLTCYKDIPTQNFFENHE